MHVTSANLNQNWYIGNCFGTRWFGLLYKSRNIILYILLRESHSIPIYILVLHMWFIQPLNITDVFSNFYLFNSQVWMGAIAILMNITCRPFSMWEDQSILSTLFPFITSSLVLLFEPFFQADRVFNNIQMLDPTGISNWSVTHVDWSEGKWHPKSYKAQDVTLELMKNITVCPYDYF